MPYNPPVRPIQFPLDRTLQPENVTPDETIENYPFAWQSTDSDERVTITLDISLNEFVALSSAIDVGRDIAYGEDSIYIWWLWQRVVNSMTLCEQINDCIASNEQTQETINMLVSNTSSDSGTPIAPDGIETVIGINNTYLSDTNLIDMSDCTQSDIAGKAIEIVKALNSLATDWIEQFVASSFPAEIIAYVYQTIPLSAAIAQPGDFIDWITDEVLTQYSGAYDDALRNEASCLIYEDACTSCDVTVDDLIRLFSTKVAIGVNPAQSWKILLDDLITLSIADQLVYGLWLLILATWKAQSLFLGVSGAYVLAYSASKSTPIDPVLIGCNPCGSDPCTPPLLLLQANQPLEDCITIINGTRNSANEVFFSTTSSTCSAIVDVELNTAYQTLNVDFEGRTFEGGSTLTLMQHRVIGYDASDNIVSDDIIQQNEPDSTWIDKSLSVASASVNVVRLRCVIYTTGNTGTQRSSGIRNIRVTQ